MTTAILGAGLTGCSLARVLVESGEEVVVLEAAEAYGGLCRSVSADGFTFDLGGSHIIFSRDEEALAWMRDVLGTNREERHRVTKCLYRGRFVQYPFENGLYDLPPEDRYACLDGFIRAFVASELERAQGAEHSPCHFLDWIYRTFGDGIAESYLVPYNEKIWKYPLDAMSAHWVDGRVPRPPLEDVVRAACGVPTEGYLHQAVFSYPAEGGIEALVRAIAAPIEDRIRCGFRVTSVRRDGGRFLISDGEAIVEADACISTIPLPDLVGALDGVPPEVADAADRLTWNAVACVFVGFRGPVPPYSWVYLPEPETGHANRISFPSNYAASTTPRGCSSILAECTYRPDDTVATMDDDRLVEHVIDRLEVMGLIRREDVRVTGVSRQPWAYIVYDLEYQTTIRTVREYVASRGIDLLGRFSEFEYLNMDGCIRHVLDYVRRRDRCT